MTCISKPLRGTLLFALFFCGSMQSSKMRLLLPCGSQVRLYCMIPFSLGRSSSTFGSAFCMFSYITLVSVIL